MADMIDRKAAIAALDQHAKGDAVIGGQHYRTLTLEVATDAIAALPAVTAPHGVAEAYENGMRRALGLVASLGYGKNEDVDRGHEEAFGAIQQDLDNWKAALAPAQPAPQVVPTDAQVASACLSYRHDFGLLDEVNRAAMMWQAKEWLHAWRKEFAALAPAQPALTSKPVDDSLAADPAVKPEMVSFSREVTDQLMAEIAKGPQGHFPVPSEWNAAIDAAALVAHSGVNAYGAKMRAATDKKEKRDWQSMLMAAVDIEHAILALKRGGE